MSAFRYYQQLKRSDSCSLIFPNTSLKPVKKKHPPQAQLVLKTMDAFARFNQIMALRKFDLVARDSSAFEKPHH